MGKIRLKTSLQKLVAQDKNAYISRMVTFSRIPTDEVIQHASRGYPRTSYGCSIYCDCYSSGRTCIKRPCCVLRFTRNCTYGCELQERKDSRRGNFKQCTQAQVDSVTFCFTQRKDEPSEHRDRKPLPHFRRE